MKRIKKMKPKTTIIISFIIIVLILIVYIIAALCHNVLIALYGLLGGITLEFALIVFDGYKDKKK